MRVCVVCVCVCVHVCARACTCVHVYMCVVYVGVFICVLIMCQLGEVKDKRAKMVTTKLNVGQRKKFEEEASIAFRRYI